MKVDFAVICDYAMIDRFGKLSVMGMFQHVWAGKFPTVHHKTHLVMRIKGARTEIGDHAITIKFVDSEGNVLLAGDGSVTLNEPPAGILEVEAGAILIFDVPLTAPGKYQFEIRVDGALETVVPVTASEAQEHTPPSPQYSN